MDENKHLSSILSQVKNGELTIKEAIEQISPSDELGFANLDIHRAKRTGFPEVIYGEGKTTEQVCSIFERLMKKHDVVLATRVSEEMGNKVVSKHPTADYHRNSKIILWKNNNHPLYKGYVAVVCAGTSDLPVAEEAVITIEAMGSKAELICDVGVAGLHRLIHKIDIIRKANVIIVVAGMEGALPSVIGGLVAKPIIAVPTSVGYGTSFKGISALLGMLNSCASGISVVNIDNGFGAGYQAGLINKVINTEGE